MQPPPQSVHWGTLPRDQARVVPHCRQLGDGFTVLPRSQWRTTRRRACVRHIFDQLDGMCTSNGATGQVMALREAAGLPFEILAPSTLYGQHSNWGTGSSLAENIDALIETGVCSADVAGGEQPWPLSKLPATWKQDAARYRLVGSEVWDLDGDFGAVVTAIMLGWFPLIGLRWPGGGGHSVLATDVIVEAGQVAIAGPNSWGATWNGDGFYTLTERECSSMGSHGAYAGRVVVES